MHYFLQNTLQLSVFRVELGEKSCCIGSDLNSNCSQVSNKLCYNLKISKNQSIQVQAGLRKTYPAVYFQEAELQQSFLGSPPEKPRGLQLIGS